MFIDRKTWHSKDVGYLQINLYINVIPIKIQAIFLLTLTR